MNEAEMNKELFAHLVVSLAQSALLHMGKLVHPGSGKAEANLEAAQTTIDMLDMIATKTKGNLDKDEDRFLQATLSELKLNFVETAKGAPAQPAAPEAKPEPKIEAPPETPKSDEDKTRFRKSYG